MKPWIVRKWVGWTFKKNSWEHASGDETLSQSTWSHHWAVTSPASHSAHARSSNWAKRKAFFWLDSRMAVGFWTEIIFIIWSSQLHSLTDPGRSTWSVVIFRFNIRYVRSYVFTCLSTSERQVRFIFKVLKICFFWFAEPHSLQSSVEEFLFYNFWYQTCHNTQPAE